MVLSRTPKQYKLFMRTLLTNFVKYQHIVTTNAKAKHLRLYGNKLFKFAKAAAAGQSSPKNLLKGRVDTKEAYTKLLLEIAPRLKDIKHNFIVVSKIFRKRRGDNAPLVTVSIKGCEKLEQRKASYQQNPFPEYSNNRTEQHKRLLLQEKAYYQKKIAYNPELQGFLKMKIARVDFQLWTYEKNTNEPSKFVLLC